MIRLLLTRAVFMALPFAVYWIWAVLARRGGRDPGATPWGWLVGAGAMLIGLSLMATAVFHPDNRGQGYVPAVAHPDGSVTPGGFDPARRHPPASDTSPNTAP